MQQLQHYGNSQPGKSIHTLQRRTGTGFYLDSGRIMLARRGRIERWVKIIWNKNFEIVYVNGV
jgi:hypothetical protein